MTLICARLFCALAKVRTAILSCMPNLCTPTSQSSANSAIMLSTANYAQLLLIDSRHSARTAGNSWTVTVSSNSRLSLRENQAFLKATGLLVPPQGNAQSLQTFTNEDANLLFRLSHHISTSISANQKPLDGSDLGYCEFLEFLCRLALTSTFKLLGDTTDVMRMQKLCNVCSCDHVLERFSDSVLINTV